MVLSFIVLHFASLAGQQGPDVLVYLYVLSDIQDDN